MKAMLRTVTDRGVEHSRLMFCCPTLSPSILSKTGPDGVRICHSHLRAGVFEFLDDCTHSLAGQHAPMLDLPEWAINNE